MRLTGHYVSDRLKGESFQDFVKRVGKVEIKKMLDDLTRLPTHDEDPSYFTDWRDTREFTIGDMGVGECAGEVVSRVEFDLVAAEREVFEANVLLDQGEFQKAGEKAYGAMVRAARALVQTQFYDIPNNPDRIVSEFRTRFYDTQLFWDPYAGGKFGQYLFHAHERAATPYTPEVAHQRIEEAQLVVEAAHSCYGKMNITQPVP